MKFEGLFRYLFEFQSLSAFYDDKVELTANIAKFKTYCYYDDMFQTGYW